MTKRCCAVVVLACWTVSSVFVATCRGEEKNLGFKLPDGFEATLFAGDDLAHDICSMTFDAQGRLVVAGPGYVKILPDNGRGKCERAILFSEKPASGAMGMYFDGPDLYCSGDKGIWRLRDSKHQDKADPPEVVVRDLANSEHGAHTIVKGPDGWLYCVAGNDAGVNKEQHVTTAASPVKEPSCGAILRFTPDGKRSEVFAHGFRNSYGIDFNPTGNLFTIDSDNERDFYLPWYAPTRLFDVQQGMGHGWMHNGSQQSWNRPASFYDGVERLCEIGRGSPTGLVCYRHVGFPEHFRGGIFSACWTLGKIYYFPLARKRNTFETKLETFLDSTGSSGFAPTSLAVGPDGDLFVSVGGRGTRGSVYRIHYAKSKPADEPKDKLARVLHAPLPLSSWSRAKWVPLAKEIGKAKFAEVLADWERPDQERIRAVEILTELFDGVPATIAENTTFCTDDVLARVAWSMGRKPLGENTAPTMVKILHHHNCGPAAIRSVWEAISCLSPDEHHFKSSEKDLSEKVGVDPRGLSLAALAFRTHKLKFAPPEDAPPNAIQVLQRGIMEGPSTDGVMNLITTSRHLDEFAGRSSEQNEQRLMAIRFIQLALGDVQHNVSMPAVWSGYQGQAPAEKKERDRKEEWAQVTIILALEASFPTRDNETNREIARTLGFIGHQEVFRYTGEKPLRQISLPLPQDDIHYLIVQSLTPGKRSDGVTAGTADTLANLHHKMAGRGWLPSRNWPLRVGELFEELCKKDPNLPAALGDSAAFGLVDHSLFVLKLKGDEQERLARRLLARVKASKTEQEWTPQFVRCLKSLPRSEYLDDLRKRWNEPALRDAIVAVLAEQPEAADRQRFIDALGSVQAKVIESAAVALTQLPDENRDAEIAAALRALRRSCQAPQDVATRQALCKLLTYWTGKKIPINEKDKLNPLPAYQGWFDWFAENHPEESKKLAASTAYDQAAWMARLAKVDFDRGDEGRGKIVFDKRSCSKCHQGSGRLGPELAGAATRFSRDDLFVAILDPSKDIAPPYRMKIVTTTHGETYSGLVVYESPEGVLLQTGPETMARVADVAEGTIRSSNVSLMPSGLLNEATDGELADLYAFLRSLKK